MTRATPPTLCPPCTGADPRRRRHQVVDRQRRRGWQAGHGVCAAQGAAPPPRGGACTLAAPSRGASAAPPLQQSAGVPASPPCAPAGVLAPALAALPCLPAGARPRRQRRAGRPRSGEQEGQTAVCSCGWCASWSQGQLQRVACRQRPARPLAPAPRRPRFADALAGRHPPVQHAFVVPLRDDEGNMWPGVEIHDCGYKVRLQGSQGGGPGGGAAKGGGPGCLHSSSPVPKQQLTAQF